MAGSRILVVEDAEAIRLPLSTALTAHGYQVQALPDGAGLEGQLAAFAPDLVVLDVMLPGRDGYALLEVVRATSRAGVVMLTARDQTADRVRGLAGGADDYVGKPFAMTELLARVQAVLRRVAPRGAEIAVGDLVLAEDGSRVSRGGRDLDLTATERRLLRYLVAHRGRVVSKLQLLTAVWGYEGFDENVVEVHVSALRRKLESAGPRMLHTVRGQGYRLEPAVGHLTGPAGAPP